MPDPPIFFFTRIVPTYRTQVLESLNCRLNERLVVCAGSPAPNSSLSTIVSRTPSSFRIFPLHTWRLRGDILHAHPFRRVFREFGIPSVVVLEETPRSLSLPFLLDYAGHRGIGRVLWGHFSSNNRPFSPNHPADRYRLALARRAESCLCYTDSIADMLRPHIPSSKLFVARNTLDTNTLFALHAQLAKEGRRVVRRRLGLPCDQPILIFIGRLLKSKGTDLLLSVFRQFRKQQRSHLVIIGGGPEDSRMRRSVQKHSIADVHFLGPMPAWSDSAPYLYAADVMLIPGYLGLSVNLAFAFGLPVISQASPDPSIRFHSPEIEYVKSGINGLLTPYGDTESLLQAISSILQNRAQFSHAALQFIHTNLTIERMIDGILAAIKHAENQTRREAER